MLIGRNTEGQVFSVTYLVVNFRGSGCLIIRLDQRGVCDQKIRHASPLEPGLRVGWQMKSLAPKKWPSCGGTFQQVKNSGLRFVVSRLKSLPHESNSSASENR